jgi:hypothetical protein
MGMAERWEYKLLVGHGLSNALRDESGVEYGQPTVEMLNMLGKEGWEVCNQTFLPATLLLKRKVSK